jgi:hypothetical protein
VTHFILAVGLLAGLLGWNHRDPETQAMSRLAGLACAAYAFVIWTPAASSWALP